MKMQHIVFLERATITAPIREPRFPHDWTSFETTRSSEIVDRLQNATIAIVNKLPLRAADLAQLPHLKLIAVAATGVDNIDLDYCRQHNIAVCNVRHYATRSLPEHVLMLMLALRRNLFNYREVVNRGEWQKAEQFCLLDHPIRDLFGARLGIVGYGTLGKAVGQLARAIGMEVSVAERKQAATVRENRVSFNDVLRQSDILSLHCPLNHETRNLIAEPELRSMKRESLLINTARGGLVNEEDLLKALRENVIAGAAVDVFSSEPPRGGNVLLTSSLPNLIITPHIAWASDQAVKLLADQLIHNLEAFVNSESRNRVV
jgi:glycerate dehydrogenase